MIALVDYGVGNLRSVYKALAAVGAEVELTADPERIRSADKVVLPGVGAFGDGMRGLQARGLAPVISDIARRGIPLLGICLGMQLLFDCSDELGKHAGLGLIAGQVRRFMAPDLKIPQTGWNQVFPRRSTPLLADFTPGCYAYFNHSYYCQPTDPAVALATTGYGYSEALGLEYPSVVGAGRLFGVQFHPEKSQSVGLQILRNFVERC